jgi:bacillithiol biosynthesis deacetylase BshB1
VLIDLTAGERSSNGTPAQREIEATEAARVLGVSSRENLGWPDGEIQTTPALVRSAVDAIRRHQPRAIAIPYGQDRHPDHVRANEVLTTAAFTSGLRRYETESPPWRPDWICCYFINDSAPPSFVIDVSRQYDRKRAALACYRSQFTPDEQSAAGPVSTRLTAPTFKTLIESRDAQFGALAGVAFAEGVIVREPIMRATLLKHRP